VERRRGEREKVIDLSTANGHGRPFWIAIRHTIALDDIVVEPVP
jgi:hypothetical protein